MTFESIVADALLCIVGRKPQLATGAKNRLSAAFRPKTINCYNMLFRLFVAFCVLTKISLGDVTVTNVVSYMEYLTRNGVSPCIRGGTSTNNSGRLLADKNSTRHRALARFCIHLNRKRHPIWRLP